jgi:hypothetical protein
MPEALLKVLLATLPALVRLLKFKPGPDLKPLPPRPPAKK